VDRRNLRQNVGAVAVLLAIFWNHLTFDTAAAAVRSLASAAPLRPSPSCTPQPQLPRFGPAVTGVSTRREWS
jgi:hypothetical protein